MAKTKPGKKDLDSYSIKGTNKVVRGKIKATFFLFFVSLGCYAEGRLVKSGKLVGKETKKLVAVLDR